METATRRNVGNESKYACPAGVAPRRASRNATRAAMERRTRRDDETDGEAARGDVAPGGNRLPQERSTGRAADASASRPDEPRGAAAFAPRTGRRADHRSAGTGAGG